MIRVKTVLAFAGLYPLEGPRLFTVLVRDKACTVYLMFAEDFGYSATHSELFLPFDRNSPENEQP